MCKCSRTFKINCLVIKFCRGHNRKFICEICRDYKIVEVSNMKRHHLVCLKRVTVGVFDHEDSTENVVSNTSRVSSCVDEGDIVFSPSTSHVSRLCFNDFASIQLSKHAFGG